MVKIDAQDIIDENAIAGPLFFRDLKRSMDQFAVIVSQSVEWLPPLHPVAFWQ
jgi:hypothetical protein